VFIAPSSAPSSIEWEQGRCTASGKREIPEYRMLLDPNMGYEEFLDACLAACANVIGNTGCEYSLSSSVGKRCDVHLDAVDSGDNRNNYKCYSGRQPVEECDGSNFEIVIKLGSYPQQIGWELKLNGTRIDSIEYKIYSTGLVRFRRMYHRICLEDYGDYVWKITDSGGDGMSGGSYYELKLNGRIIGEGDQNIGAYKEHTFDIYETAFPSIAPSLNPSTTAMPSRFPTLSSSPSLSNEPTITSLPSVTPSTAPSTKSPA